jgi:SAM-dependent methyltransferase
MHDLVAVYDAGDEDARMAASSNRVEWLRTLELLERWLPAAPASILDVGGGPGRYAEWLAHRGYSVTLFDPVPKHIDQARARGVSAELGDARELPVADHSVDAVLLLGPLYHLPSPADRAVVIQEAVRCVVPGGVVIAAGMSRWAKPIVKATLGELDDPAVQRYLIQVLEHGHDPAGDAFDRVTYSHDPSELQTELETAGLTNVDLLGIEGPLGVQARLDESLVDLAIETARLAEQLAPHFSIHLLASGIAPSADRV